MQPLISVDELERIRPRIVLCDIRWDLTDPSKGRKTYERGHIPGALFVDLDSDLAAPPGAAGRHPLPTPKTFASTLSSLGIDPDTHVVVYDDAGGRIAARMWWMLRAIDHERVQVLDGGYQAWTAAGKDIGVGTVTAAPASYPEPDGFSGAVTHDQLDGKVVVDARAPERYRGDIEPVDPKAGHIPGAVSIPTEQNLAEDGRFLLATDLEAIYADIPDAAVVSCGSGVTACHDALAMVLAGRPMPDVYVGSFSEWSRLDLPVNTGPHP
ncbi:MAG: sulfurtransferase [Acidimicrobiia bacterium]|jgi:thiosulfate/3-mercaptopyruvate sulfurtransferase